MIDYKKEIVKDILSLSGSKSPYDVFRDWVECMAITIENSLAFNHDDFWKKREERYLKIVSDYEDKGETFSWMFANLQMAYENETTDILGEIYMKSGCGSKSTGQFFTPFHINLVIAQAALEGTDLSKPIVLNEPSCGAGGMIIGVAAELKEHGVNYQKVMNVVAQDLDWKAVIFRQTYEPVAKVCLD